MKIGMTELLVVFIVALFVIGPDKLPYYAKKLGEALGQFRKYSDDAARDIKESIVEPLKEAQEPLREAMEPLEELDRSVRGNVKEMKDSFNDLGKAKKSGSVQKKPEAEAGTAEGAEMEAASPEPEKECGETPEYSGHEGAPQKKDGAEEMEELQRKIDELQKKMEELQGKEVSA